MNKATTNYWVDMLIGVAFIGSAISGLVFLLPGDVETGVLWVSYRTWNGLHTWSSLAMIAGVGLHLLLHWKWLVSMTKRTFSRRARPARLQPVAVCVEAREGGINRRGFICMGVAGLATLAGALAAVKALSADDKIAEAAADTVDELAAEQASIAAAPSAEPTATAAAAAAASAATSTAEPAATVTAPAEPTATAQAAKKLTVKCPKGLTYDPYPGRCRLYRDTNGDGYCDYSIPS